MGKQIAMEVEEEKPTQQKVKKSLHKRIVKPKVTKMSVEKVVSKIKRINESKKDTTEKDVKKIGIFRQLKKSLESKDQKGAKLSKGKKKRSLLREKLNFKRQLDDSILNKKPIDTNASSNELPQTSINKSMSLGTQ